MISMIVPFSKTYIPNKRGFLADLNRSGILAYQKELKYWCMQHCTGNWNCNYLRFEFEKPNDAMLFKLTFGGK